MIEKGGTPRLRIFAGPNGSGKSTLAEKLINGNDKRIKLYTFVNADEIEQMFNQEGSVSLYNFYRFKSTTKQLRKHLEDSGAAEQRLGISNISLLFKIIKNRIYYSGKYNSYIAADIASFIRAQLLERGKSFSFETVFSHESKLQIIQKAREKGYKVYFYFISTEDPDINVNRVNLRVAMKGHPVLEKKIRDRYYRSLDLLISAIRLCNRAFLFDNSSKYYKLVAEVIDGKKVDLNEKLSSIPNWFVKYVYDRSKVK